MRSFNKLAQSLQRIAWFSGFYLLVCAALIIATLKPVQADEITVFAASSLRDVLGEVSDGYEAETGTKVVLVFAATSAIARQVALGAPADVVLLADQDWADWLVAERTVESVSPFAGNRLVLIGRDQAPIQNATDIAAVLDGQMLAMAQVVAVPAGRYGKAALVSLGLWDEVSAHVVQAANVRAALRFVERREVAFGIGYASDLVALPDLMKIYEFDTDTHPEIVYLGAQVTPDGVDFIVHLQSVAVQGVLSRWGFSPLDIVK